MCDAAAAIHNGISKVYEGILPGECYFHMMQSMKARKYNDDDIRKNFLRDVSSLSKSNSMKNFHVSVDLFLEKYKNHSDPSVRDATTHFEKYWLTPANIGWHSGLLAGTVTTNNGVEVTNRVFKAGLKGLHSLYNVFFYIRSMVYTSS